MLAKAAIREKVTSVFFHVREPKSSHVKLSNGNKVRRPINSIAFIFLVVYILARPRNRNPFTARWFYILPITNI